MGSFSLLILTIGIPGAGKSTWVKEYQKQHPQVHVVSTDQIRKELTGSEQCLDPSKNHEIHEEARRRVKEIISNPEEYGDKYNLGPEIIVDSTNVEIEEWLSYKNLDPSIMIAKVFDITVEEAVNRQKTRERQVPKEIIEEKWFLLKHNMQFLSKIFNLIIN